MAADTGTYVYCVIAAARRPSRAPRRRRELPGTPVGCPAFSTPARDLFVIAATVPLKRYGEAALRRGLTNLDWVSRAAVAHERVVESFVAERAVLPMKLFTIFTSDVRVRRARCDTRPSANRHASLKRLANQQEWGVRVILDKARANGVSRQKDTGGVRPSRTRRRLPHEEESPQRDASMELAGARPPPPWLGSTTGLRIGARLAKRRPAGEKCQPADRPLLLDAAFLVPRASAGAFRALAVREARDACPKTDTGLP